MIERKVNPYGQEQIINNLDKIVKIGNRYLQVRLIQTRKWKSDEFTESMPRAKFVNPDENKDVYYFVNRSFFHRKQKKLED